MHKPLFDESQPQRLSAPNVAANPIIQSREPDSVVTDFPIDCRSKAGEQPLVRKVVEVLCFPEPTRGPTSPHWAFEVFEVVNATPQCYEARFTVVPSSYLDQATAHKTLSVSGLSVAEVSAALIGAAVSNFPRVP